MEAGAAFPRSATHGQIRVVRYAVCQLLLTHLRRNSTGEFLQPAPQRLCHTPRDFDCRAGVHEDSYGGNGSSGTASDAAGIDGVGECTYAGAGKIHP